MMRLLPERTRRDSWHTEDGISYYRIKELAIQVLSRRFPMWLLNRDLNPVLVSKDLKDLFNHIEKTGALGTWTIQHVKYASHEDESKETEKKIYEPLEPLSRSKTFITR